MITSVLKVAGMIVVFVAAYWSILFLAQRKLMYPAPIPFGSESPPAGGEGIWLKTSAGTTEAWWLPPMTSVEPPFVLLMFGHGNGELIDYWSDAFDEPRRWGMAVLLVEYPGYGRSGGEPSERTISASFRAAYDWAVDSGKVDANRIVGYGRSLGAAAVAGLSMDRQLAALILESTFTSTRPFARRFGAPGFLVRDVFDNTKSVAAFEGPVTVIHGVDDDIIPIQHGRRLAEIAGVQVHELPCGHNDCPQSWSHIRQFLADAQVLPIEGDV